MTFIMMLLCALVRLGQALKDGGDVNEKEEGDSLAGQSPLYLRMERNPYFF